MKAAGDSIAEGWQKACAKLRRKISPAKAQSQAALGPDEHLKSSRYLLKHKIIKRQRQKPQTK